MLKEMGSTATELVNSAYLYLIKYGRLPKEVSSKPAEAPQTKTLEGDEARAFQEQWRKRAVFSGGSYDGGNFKELLDEARGAYYARFA